MKVTLDEVKIKSRRENHKANEKLHWFSSKISIYFSYFLYD